MKWTMILAPMFLGDREYQWGTTWLIFPDLKMHERAKGEWAGKRYREATFTMIKAVANHYFSVGGVGAGYNTPWGSSLMLGISRMMVGADGNARLLRDQAALDPIIKGGNSLAAL